MGRLWILTGLAALALPGVAAAAPHKIAPHKSARPPSLADTPEAQLRRGRALAARHRYADAVKVLDAALRAMPDDPRVLNELGVALRETGDLARAETVCRDAAKAEAAELRAAALYNLGRVLERRGQAEAAIAAYQDSLRIRHTRAVRERLVALDPMATSEVTRTHPLDGPVASIEDWCNSQKAGQCDLHNNVLDPDPDSSQRSDPQSPWQPGRHSPWQEMRVFVVQAETTECALGVRTARGWFVGRVMDCSTAAYPRHAFNVELEDVIASAQGDELQLDLSSVEGYRTWDPETRSSAYAESEFEALVVCGLGPSGTPHCTPSIQLTTPDKDAGSSENAGPSEAGSWDCKLAARWAKGLLILESAAGDGTPLKPSSCPLAGRHRVIFP
jgi:tetratricopeptide (TPR) repeat protein